jgi:hypothetical protein
MTLGLLTDLVLAECHCGLSAYSELDLAKKYSRWPRILEWFQALFERGETVDDRKHASAS